MTKAVFSKPEKLSISCKRAPERGIIPRSGTHSPVPERQLPPGPYFVFQSTGLSVGKNSTSRMEAESVSSMTSRSMP